MDLNSDLGESFGRWVLGDDKAVLQVVTSANVACGFYAGDPSTLRRTCAMAAARGVAVGAQVGYRDLAADDRRAEPRTRVPAGSVGLAGEYSGVYPRESPGGWQLIGHTDAVLWDLRRRPPALLQPGAIVRFVQVSG